MPFRRSAVLVAAVVMALSTVSGCTSDGPIDMAPTGCAATCTGTLAGAPYLIRMPAHWNGTLLLFSHGYRAPGAPNEGQPQVSSADGTGTGIDQISTQLLQAGYALAGSGYRTQGWATAEAVQAADDLYGRFVALHGKPERTYVWGVSFGGLVTALLAERATWADGAAALCGAVAGPLRNFDNGYETLAAIRALVLPDLRVDGFGSSDAASAEGRRAADALLHTAFDRAGGGTAKVVYIAETAGMPTRSVDYPNGQPLPAAVQALMEYVQFIFTLLYQVDERFGGNPATAQAPPAVTPAAAAAVRSYGGDPEEYAAAVATAGLPLADPAARRAAEASGDPTGRLRVPTVALHTVDDQIVVVANESVLRDRVAAAGRSARLAQLYVRNDASALVGHCRFTPEQTLGTLTILDRWVRTGTPPSPAAVGELGPGADPAFVPPAWP